MKLFSVQKEIEFDAGHRVPLHASKCKNPHGHRYKVRATVAGHLQEEGSATGMVIDFGDIKQLLTERVHDVFDHGFIVHVRDIAMMKALGQWYDPEHQMYVNDNGWKVIVVDWTPTAEEMAAAIYRDLWDHIPGLQYIDVWETPTSVARYPFGEED